ncbi:MAG: flavin reductase [Flavobacteriales bacterium CG_4_9_14_0_2_um_filter_35_242]|nr:MAG: flavin reductase [Flavobacteriaceae bacterium CG1_02_35_72]PJA06448.1 MAG: flavin reductase [Flavobacteriales bacterium CG_4_10_14_0_2_um_filter_35_18]PJC60598.1 MAG: flavin reductase [Flavobacteriales bacterium CG_4_9_14_0_2_um_filter_35_242]
MLSIKPNELPTAKLHAYLLSAVAPRPIAFASTVDLEGHPNLSPFSFFNVFSAHPPILIFSPARRVTNNTTKHTLENVIATKEVVINVVNYDLVHQMSLASTEYKKGVNEFEKAGLTMLKSELVKPFRVAESPIQMECKVNEVVALGKEGGAGNLVICELVCMHINQAFLDADGLINQQKLDLVARAGGNFYSRAKNGFFEIPKPLSNLGIGVDALPKTIRESAILTGNNLGMLANIETLPTKNEIATFVAQQPQLAKLSIREKHLKAQEYLKNNNLEAAWLCLLI